MGGLWKKGRNKWKDLRVLGGEGLGAFVLDFFRKKYFV